MVDPIGDYLAILRQDLSGRIPSDFMESILGEADAHLRDLASELGSQEAAVKKFGGARRYARRILREFTPTPNPWRACLFPFSVMVLAEAFFLLSPPSLFQRLSLDTGPFAALPMIMLGIGVLTWVGLYRARQILIGPLAAFATAHVLIFACIMATRVTPLVSEGFVMRGAFRQDSVAETTRSIDEQIHRWTTERDTLRDGIKAFATAKAEGDIKRFRYRGQYWINPQSIVAPLEIDDDGNRISAVLLASLFASESRPYGGADSTFAGAVQSWKIYGPDALARVEKEVAQFEKARAAIPRAQSQPFWVSAWMLVPSSLLSTLRMAVIVLKLNLSAWFVWLVVRRFRLPHRRYA